MTSAHLHLLLNHLPIITTIIGACLLIWATIRNSDEIRKVSFVLFVAAALIAIPTLLTGHQAEDIVEGLPGVNEAFIEEHEEAATLSFWTLEVLGAVSLLGLVLSRRNGNIAKFSYLPLALALVTAGMMAWTAELGGEIRHTEIRSGAEATAPGGGEHEEGGS
jgi:uncharacterized membrane protein